MQVREIMTKKPITVTPETEIHELANLFVAKGFSGAPVLDKAGKFVGIVLEEGLIIKDKKIHLPTFFFMLSGFFTFGEKQFETEMKKIAATTVEGIMEDSPHAISSEMEVEEVATLMVEKGIHYFPVLNGGKLVGVVTKKDLVKAIAKGEI
jgi:CBS domain-containing protein